MDAQTLAYLQDLHQAVARGKQWKAALDALIAVLRRELVFDNVAVYLHDPQTNALEVAHARAVGRGRSAEADAAWGEGAAARAYAGKEVVIQESRGAGEGGDRLAQAELLALPLQAEGWSGGALVFIRFGGPPYLEDHLRLASLAAVLISSVFERQAWQEARKQLEVSRQQIRLQDDFMATISHELRTPLGFIKGYSTTLLRQDTRWDNDTQREFLTIIDEEADHLTELIENILESARLQSNTVKMQIHPLRLDALIRDVIMRVRNRHRNLEIELDFDVVPPIKGDAARLAQVFENLFSNAVKYAPASPIKITLRRAGKRLKVAFADRGPGIPQESLPFIFDRFYRVPGGPTVTGTGLGLYICSQIIQAHHGKMWVESALNEGTTFFIELPAEPML